jgi:vancomycin resistance protein YoaR
MTIPLEATPQDAARTTAHKSRRRDLRVTANVLQSVFFLAALVFIGLVAGAAMYGLSHSNRIYEGISVAGIEVGGMTRSEARAALRDHLKSATEQPVLLVSGDQEFLLDPRATGIQVDLDATVDAAFVYGRSGSVFERSGRWFHAILFETETPVRLAYDQANLDATLMSIAPAVTRPAIDAYVRFNASGEPEIVPELPGYVFDLAETRERMLRQIASLTPQPVEIDTPIIPATVQVADLTSGLAQTESAVATSLIIHGEDTSWAMSQADIRSIVAVGGDTHSLVVNRDAVQQFVESIAAATDRDARDADITVENSALVAVPGQTGIRVQVAETANLIIGALEQGLGSVTLAYESQPPQISTEQAAAAVADGEAMLERGLTLTWDEEREAVSRQQLLRALTVTLDPGSNAPFTFGFNREALGKELAPLFEDLESPVREPVLRYVDGEITIAAPGQDGTSVDVDATVDNVISAILAGETSAELVVKEVKPELNAQAIAEIGLDDVLAESSTYYGDSSAARRHNVETAAELQSGWLIAPGEQFSYAEYIGPVDEASGFVTGFGIVDDFDNGGVTTAPVVGGGICQVSTTIFQAAFWAGLQIDERYSHPYWIQAYGEPPRGMEGLDAMVNIEESGSLDLKFTNTTDNWMAVEVVADGTSVTVRILGTDPGWTVDIEQPEISSEIEPDQETRYTDSPELPDGQQLQVEFAQRGFTAEITRTVSAEDGEVLDVTTLVSSYAPSQNTILRGTGAPEATPSPEGE